MPPTKPTATQLPQGVPPQGVPPQGTDGCTAAKEATLNKTTTSCRGGSDHIAALDAGAPDIAASRAAVFLLPRSSSVFFADMAVTDKKKESRRQFCRVTRRIRGPKHERIWAMPNAPCSPRTADPFSCKPNTNHGFYESNRQTDRRMNAGRRHYARTAAPDRPLQDQRDLGLPGFTAWRACGHGKIRRPEPLFAPEESQKL